MNPYNQEDRERLFRSMDWSYRKLDDFRKTTRKLVEEYAGSSYGESASVQPRRETVANVLNQAVRGYVMALVGGRPRALVTARNPAYNYFAKQYQLAINNLMDEIHLGATLRRWVVDAFFGAGILKVHMGESAPVELEQGVWMDPGKPFASNVSLDRFVFDMSASDWHMVRYAGDMYRIPFSDLQDELLYDQDVAKKLRPTSKYTNKDADRLETISRGTATDEDELEPMISLVDVWSPRTGRISTFAMDHGGEFTAEHPPVAEVDWDGCEEGPYSMLGFVEVPGNVMPASLAAQLWPLHRSINNILRKQDRRSRSHKIIHTYTPSGADAAKNIQRASDDEWKEVSDPREIGQIEVGGVSQHAQGFFRDQLNLFDRMSGNLPALLGLGAQADTLGQEQMLNAAVSVTVDDMRDAVRQGTGRVVKNLGRLLWADQVTQIPGELGMDGMPGYSVDATWTPGDREGTPDDYTLEIDVHSLPYRSPTQRVQAMNYLVSNVYLPLMPLLQQAGGGLDMKRLVEFHANQLDEPVLKEIVTFTAVPGDVAESGGMAPQTTRNYVRQSVPSTPSPQSQINQSGQTWGQDSGLQGSPGNATMSGSVTQ